MYSDKPFPLDRIILTRYLERIWKSGWLDDFSEKHFLIRAIYNEISDIEWRTQLLSNNTLSRYSPINPEGEIDYNQFTVHWILNFSVRLEAMDNYFGEKNIRRFIEDQLSAGKKNYDCDQFFQALSEIEILSFLCSRANWESITYEPPIGRNGANPEACFSGNIPLNKEGDVVPVNVNVEVKTPAFPHINITPDRIILPTVLLSTAGRERMSQICKDFKFKFIQPRMTKLVDFLNSAAKKFTVPGSQDLNLLFINWSYSDYPSNSFLEAWSLLTNEVNGLLTHPEIAMSLPINNPVSKDVYEKISAVIVYTNSLEQLMFSDFRYVWQRHPIVECRFRMFVLNDELRKKELSDQSRLLYNILGMNPDLPESNKWRILSNCNWDDNTTEDERENDWNAMSLALSTIEEHSLSI